jgi:hypothetical protein
MAAMMPQPPVGLVARTAVVVVAAATVAVPAGQ